MNFLFEFFLIGCIISLSFYILKTKNKQTHAKSLIKENISLKNQLTEKESDFNSREHNLNNTIKNLQSSFELHQISSQNINDELKNKESRLLKDYSSLRKILSQKKSSEVRLGSIAETLAPFLNQFEFNPEHCTFLGKPIDYISFGPKGITFIEIKSGKSQLNKKQREIRDQVKEKLVFWKEVRIQ